jgi:voltage-gated potassium channel
MELETAGADLDIAIEEVRVPPGSALDGTLLRDSDLKKELGLMVVAIRKPDGKINFNPSANTKLQESDTLVLIGNKENLAKLDKMNRED